MSSDHLFTGQTHETQHTDFRNAQIKTETASCPSTSHLKLPHNTLDLFLSMPIRFIAIHLNSLQVFKLIMFLKQAFFYIHNRKKSNRMLIFLFFFSPLRQNTKEPLNLIFPTVCISTCRPPLTVSLQEKCPSFRVRYDSNL